MTSHIMPQHQPLTHLLMFSLFVSMHACVCFEYPFFSCCFFQLCDEVVYCIDEFSLHVSAGRFTKECEKAFVTLNLKDIHSAADFFEIHMYN